MDLMRSIANYYATLPGMTVPAERFTEGYRSQLDRLPAIVYQRTGEPRDYHQQGVGMATATVQMSVWAETPGQAHRIAKELENAFYFTNEPMGSGDDQVFLFACRLDTKVDGSEYPQDGSAQNANDSTLYFEFKFQPVQPVRPS